MNGIRRKAVLQSVVGLCILGTGLTLASSFALAQGSSSAGASRQARSQQPVSPGHSKAGKTVPALFLSDIHFEPFWDPGKAPQLAAAPVSEWKAILAAPPQADREQRFSALQQSCHARGADTSYTLFESSLQAARANAADATFVTVSGDLMAHAFSCKYKTVFPLGSPQDHRAFAEKTLAFVMQELDGAFPGIPVIVALGNNDSDCGDYQLDAHSEFLSATGELVAKGLPEAQRAGIQETFAAGGYYSVPLPAPVANARMLVLNDLFMSKKYATCGGKPDPGAAVEQLAWLAQQLAEARRAKQKVWVMAHIPPGVDVHATLTKMRDVCGGQKPEMFLSSEQLADELVEFGDVAQLAIFAHTHMDEMRVLAADGDAQAHGVAAKLVASISPINGNAPSFTLARVDPASAALVDYRVIAASNQTGVNATWKQTYDFAQTYRAAAFSVASVSALTKAFQADPSAKTEASQDYIRDFFVGNSSPLLALAWPQYTCSLGSHTAEGYRACVCPAAK
jgi:sphingomyelin phosphodiesterase acid-like 3